MTQFLLICLLNFFDVCESFFDSRFQTNTSLGPSQNPLFGNGVFIDVSKEVRGEQV